MTKLEICNLSLDKLAVSPIRSLTDGEVANLCNRTYDISRLFLLRTHLWNFSIRRVKVESVSTFTGTPIVDYEFVYRFPLDGLIRLLDSDVDYVYENGLIFSDAEELEMRAVVDVGDPEKFNIGFTQLLVTYMAFQMSEKLTQSDGKKASLYGEFRDMSQVVMPLDTKERNCRITVKRS